MTYAAEYDRLWQEARALCASEAASPIAPSLSPRLRAGAQSALLAHRIRLSSIVAAIAAGQSDRDQAGQGATFIAGPAPASDPFPELAQALTSLEQRLSALQQAPSTQA